MLFFDQRLHIATYHLSTPAYPQSGVKIDISEAPDGVLSRVQITVNDGCPAGPAALAAETEAEGDSAEPPPPPPASGAQWSQFEFLLSDTTIRAS